MGQATRTTKLALDLRHRAQGGANTDKRAFLEATVQVLNAARAFYVEFFLAHAEKLSERVSYYSEHHLEMRERAISANELLTWAECSTVATNEHPHPSSGWNFSERFPDLPFVYRRSVIKETVFVTDHGLDAHRYRHLKRIAKKQWLSGKPVKGEHSNQQLWQHVGRMNEDAAHKVACDIASVCAKYPGSVLLFERLRKIRAKGKSKSRRMNRRQANQVRGKIMRYAKDKAFVQGVVTVEVNPHGTSQFCSRCGAKGERFSILRGKRITAKWGKLFWCPVCHYQANADLNASQNVHHSFYRQWHWQPRKKAPSQAASSG
jgi:IS605 OrfB family transposase